MLKNQQIHKQHIALYVAAASLYVVIVVALSAPGLAATTSNVAATVTTQNISVSVSDGSVTYGTLGPSSSRSTTAADLNDVQTATNDGNVAEDFNLRGQNSTNWTLAGSAGADQYVHQFCVSACTTPPTNYTALTTNYQQIANSKSPLDTQLFDLRITTPSSSTVYTQQSVDVTVQAVID
jgi:hypothetical protein